MRNSELTPEEAQDIVRAYVARLGGSAAAQLAVGASITGVLAKYDGDLIQCPACAGAGRFEHPTDTVLCAECEGRGHLNGEPVELLRVVNGKLVEHLVRGEPVALPPEED